MPPTVVWTHRAERRLQAELIRCDGDHGRLAARTADLNARLAHAFPGADTVVVLDAYLGFRPRDGEHILSVDVRHPHACGTAIVKLADDPRRLDRELAAWLGCTPVCFPGNAVFMRLEPRHAGHPPRLVALVYQDAQPHIGADETVWLEAAVLRAVRFGAPDLGSVLAAVRELFTHLGRVLYGAARVEAGEPDPGCDPPPAGPAAIELNPRDGARRRLAGAFPRWTDRDRHPGPVGVRQEVYKAFPLSATRYIDPVDYFAFLEAELAAGTPPGLVLPRCLRGPAHGDLHGRNVLVGVDENRAGTPTVFDYENMSSDNLLGWDFVKLETELKVRALDAVLPKGRLSAFAARVEEFETRLAGRTAHCREHGWPPAPDPAADPLARLEAVVLAVREQAEAYLETRPKRFRAWLHEYYFLLGCYGVSAGRFDNLNDRERAAGLVSAGVAAAEYEQGRPGAGPIGGVP